MSNKVDFEMMTHEGDTDGRVQHKYVGNAVFSVMMVGDPNERYRVTIEALEPALKPCPFCGGEAVMRKAPTIAPMWYVECTNCGIHTPDTRDKGYVAREWNRRAE